MKQYVICISMACLLFFPVAGVHARHSWQYGNMRGKQNKNRVTNRQQVYAILQKQQAAIEAKHNAAEKTTSATAERLIAYSDYNNSYADTPSQPVGIMDSGYYYYSGQNGSVFNTDYMEFMAPSGGYFAAGADFGYFFDGLTHSFSTNINVSGVLADTSLYWNSNATDTSGNAVYAFAEKVNDLYDVNKNITFCSDDNYPYPAGSGSGAWDNYINTYDGANNITGSLDLLWNGAGWDTNAYTYFIYNSGELIEDSVNVYTTGVWSPLFRDNYTYNPSGNLVYVLSWFDGSGTWAENEQYFMTYNADNSLHTDSSSQNGSGAWLPGETDSFGYTPGAGFWTYLKYDQYTNPGIYETIVSKHVNPLGMPDSLYVSDYNFVSAPPFTLTNGEKIVYIYDAYNNPAIAYRYPFDISDPVSGSGSYSDTAGLTSHFYYATYTTGVNKVNTVAGKVTVFPNPAANAINISISGIASGTYISVRLENMQGQTVITENGPWMNVTEALPIAGIAPGMYVVLISDGQGNTLSTQKIVKQ